jgi:WD40 repeat protein
VHAAEVVETFAFAPDDRTLATGGKQGSIVLWDFLSLKPKRAPLQSGEGRGQEFSVAGLAFDRQGAILAAAGGDTKANSIGLWDVGTGRLLGRLQASRLSTIWTVDFSGDGRVLASGGMRSDLNKEAASRGAWEYEIIFWDVAPDSWAQAARLSSAIVEEP